MATQTKDFYRILDVAENASADEIKKAYRKLAKQYHPDANPNNAAAADRFKEASEAYAVLSDAEKRKKYDQMRKFGGFGMGGGGFGGFGGGAGTSGAPAGGATAGPGGFSFEDIGGGGLGDIFGSIFDFGRRKARTGGPQRGQDVEYAVEIPFAMAARGGKLPISVPITEDCATCHGSGAAPGTSPTTCPECKGRGNIVFGQGGFAVTRPCPACYGRGTIPTIACTTCGGQGQLRQQRQLQVTVPAGVDTGSKLRIPGKGERGAAGGEGGDLLISFRVQEDRFFTRDGLDLHCEVPINLAQAVLGSRMAVRTIDGKVNLRIPPGTQNGTRFRIKGQGVEKNAQRGDQYVRVQVTVPTNLDAREEALLKQFAEAAELKF
jgi:molecular chaperone DnaJ